MTRVRLLFCALGVLPAWAQPRVQALAETTISSLPAQKVGVDDLITVSVYESPEISRTVRVNGDGSIRLPLLREPVKVAGLFPAEIETKLATALREQDLLVRPIVTVSVAEYRSRPISVAGAVRKPVTFQATGEVTLLNALTRAEGLSAEAGPEILVSKVQADESGSPHLLVLRISVKGLIDAVDPALNVKLSGGEEIRVPDIGRVYVIGSVKTPGAFPLRDANEMTVMKALALAGGIGPFANKQGFLYRKEANGGKTEIPIELQKLMERKAEDVPLMASDILYIPDNKGRRLTSGMLEKIITFGTTTASGVLIWGAAAR